MVELDRLLAIPAALFDAVPEFVLDGDDDGGDPAWLLSPANAAGDDDNSLGLALRMSHFKAGIVEMMQEYFQAQEVGEVAARLAELQTVCGSIPSGGSASGSLGAVFVKRAVITALDFTAREFVRSQAILHLLVVSRFSLTDGV